MPELRDNEYILTGYRCGYQGVFGNNGVLKTLFIWHNETVNVWSHLIGVIIFVILALAIGFGMPNMSQ